MRRFMIHTSLPFYCEAPGDGGAGGGAPATGTPAAAAATPAATGTPAPASATPGSPAPPAASSGFTYKEDRSDWIPRHRFNEVSQRAQQREHQLATEQARVRALSGVGPADPQAAERQEIKSAFLSQFPQFAPLVENPKFIERLVALAGNADQIEQTNQHYWTNLGARMVDSLRDAVSDEIGGELSPRQRSKLGQAYLVALQNDIRVSESQGRESQMLRRHEMQDPSLIQEFAKEWIEDWVTPVRRQATATSVDRITRARVPGGRTTPNVVTGTKKPINFGDEKATEDAAVEAFLAHGGAFGSR